MNGESFFISRLEFTCSVALFTGFGVLVKCNRGRLLKKLQTVKVCTKIEDFLGLKNKNVFFFCRWKGW